MFKAPANEVIDSGGFQAPEKDLVEQPGIIDQVKTIVDQYKNSQLGSPQDLLGRADSFMTKGFDKAGEMTTEAMTKEGANPNLAAGVGTAIQMAPDLARMIVPGEQNISRELKPLAKKGIGALLGPSEEAIQARFDAPKAIKNASSYTHLAEDLSGTINKLSDNISQLDDQAWGSLLKLKAEPRERIVSILNDAKKEFIGSSGAKIGDADEKAVAQINDYIDRVKQITQKGSNPRTAQFLDQNQIRELIQSIRNDTRFDLPDTDPVNRAVQHVQAKIDGYLKGENSDYEAIMKPLAEQTKLLKDTVRTFSLKNDRGSFIPSDTTAGKFRQFLDEKKSFSRDVLERLSSVTGKDYLAEAANAKNAMEFSPGATRVQGSRRVNIGAGTGVSVGSGVGAGTSSAMGMGPIPGAVVGGIVGGGVGTSLGALTDQSGGVIAGSLLDNISKNPQTPLEHLLRAIFTEVPGRYKSAVQSMLQLVGSTSRR